MTDKSGAQSREVAVIEDWSPYVLGERKLPVSDPEDTARTIQDEILRAPDIDAILSAGEAVPFDDLVGVPLRFLDSQLRSSTFSSGVGCYCLIKVQSIHTGDTFFTTCGALKVITKLWAAHRMGAYPFEAQLTNRDIGDGKQVKSIVPLARRIEQAPVEAEVVEG